MDKSWIEADRRSSEYEEGVEMFLRFAASNASDPNFLFCPCSKCVSKKKKTVKTIRDHLYFSGFSQTYKNWIWHGQPPRSSCPSPNKNVETTSENQFESETVEMCEAVCDEFDGDLDEFYKFVEDADQELYEGCHKHTKLSTLVSLYNKKAKYGWSDISFSDLLVTISDLLPSGNVLPTSMYEAKKILTSLGMDYQKIHACPNDCILYRNDYRKAQKCPKCDLSRWKVTKDLKEKKGVPAKVLWYFPPIPRFKRMFRSRVTAKDLTWHDDGRVNDGKMRHPADSPSWRLVDHKWPDFAKEPRNLRLALSADGINPHSALSSRYSVWPVILVTYNLPPSLCMKRKFMMLTLLISGPKQPGNDIDIYLAPLIEDLKLLWKGIDGVYDAYREEIFTLRAILLWAIHDFPAYGNLSGCAVKGYKACPICGDKTDAVWLDHGKKMSYGGHRKFLPRYHPYRRQRKAFNDKQEFGSAPIPLSGEEVFEQVKDIECDFGKKGKKADPAQCWKKRSIFFDLIEYWVSLHIRHILDVMHIEKNIFESLIGTLLNMPFKTKDGVAARLDLVDMGVRLDLAPEIGEKRTYLPPAPYTLARIEKKSVCGSLFSMKVPERFSSNIRNLVSMEELKLFGLKSHDCHILMQHLLPIAIRGVLPKHVRYSITRLCFFFNALCSKVVDVAMLDKIQADLVLTLCELEKIFPPSFFDITVHLTVHLVREVRLCGPVFFHWMFPFERNMKVYKGNVRNRYRPEGCIAENYISEEAVEFCSEYLSHANPIGVPKPKEKLTKPLSVAKPMRVDKKSWQQAHLNVLTNNDEVYPYIKMHKAYLEQIYVGKSKQWLQNEHNKNFSKWLQQKVAEEIEHKPGTISQTLRWLAERPSRTVLKYDGYQYNSCKYNTEARDNVRAVQNSGVSLVAKTMLVASAKDKKPVYRDVTYYGVIQEIWELDYHKFRAPIFLCKWVETTKGIRQDELGFTLVSLGRIGHKNDPFASAAQVKQVFYIVDPLDEDWSIVLETPSRDFNDSVNDDELVDEDFDHPSFCEEIPPVEGVADDMNEDEGDMTYKRDNCEGIWIEQLTKNVEK